MAEEYYIFIVGNSAGTCINNCQFFTGLMLVKKNPKNYEVFTDQMAV